jgi:hypothetical protein
MTARVHVLPPGRQIGPITPEERCVRVAGSLVAGAGCRAAPRRVHPPARMPRSAGMAAFARFDPPARGPSAGVAVRASVLPLRLVLRPHATVPIASTPTDAADAAREQRDQHLAALLAEAAGGSAKAFEAFHDATCGMAQGVARRIVAADAVDDVLVESYFQAWQQAARFDAQRGSAASWLLTIVRSRALDLLRRERVRAFAAVDEHSADAPVDERQGP